MRVKFWGTRGSIPSPGPSTVRYGGNTPCVEVRSDGGTLLILDCGTGVRDLGEALLAEMPVTGHILLSHTHWDHIQGFPFFKPALAPGNHFTIHGAHNEEKRLEDVLAGQQEYTYFPLSLQEMAAKMGFHEIVERSFSIDGVGIAVHDLHHPHSAVGYRIEADGKVLVYASDHERYAPARQAVGAAAARRSGAAVDARAPSHQGDRALAQFVRDADLLILDAQYTEDEYRGRAGWGHSTMDYATAIALAAGVRRLALFHHDPTHTDDMLDRFVDRCRERVAKAGSALEVFGARERQEILL
jgi:phosphoribosyl 1,2-cyclic phosphodiesterase